MTKRHVGRLLAAISVGAGLAFAVPVLPAVGQVSPPAVVSVEVGDEATLVARGAAVLVPVEVTCPAGTRGHLSVRVTQRVGSRIASGFGGTSDFVCTGATQVVEVLVTAQGQAFKKGSAVAEASLFAPCFDFFCGPVTDTENIEIVR
ncbi:MAG TPA: hypothetical protein VGV86_14650 [Acidimicrobiales bacterium]|nr:hypothetical protein [Acidimicrobiales bacterium]